MTKTTRIVCLCILGAVGMLCGIPTAYASLSRCSETLINHTNITHYNCDSNDHPIVNQAVGDGETPQWPIDDKPGLLLDKDKPIAPSQDLQITENITTLQEQEGCETAILANYAYLADGTKFKATNADGDGFVYTGSLRWRLKDGVLTPESVAITGGRAVCDTTDTWAANYYICDHLGSVRTVTDENGTVLANYDYLPYGTDMLRDAATADVTDYRFTGKELQRDFGANLYDSFARFQHNNGRFLSIDPKAEAFYHISPYAYCAGNPVNLVDPDGEIIIFINGFTPIKREQGRRAYWQDEYRGRKVDFVTAIQRHLHDDQALFVHSENIFNVNKRIKHGTYKARQDYNKIMSLISENGEIKDDIKIVTHSMGAAYGKGYVKELSRLLLENGYDDSIISLVVDFDPFQAKSLKANPNITTVQFTHKGIIAEQKQHGILDTNYHEDPNDDSHSIISFIDEIKEIPRN